MLIQDAVLADGRHCDVRVSGEIIAAVADQIDPDPDERVIHAGGNRLLPGMIDVHVHVREPGATHKETWHTASRSGAAGGVTTIVDQPNTDPPTVSGQAYDTKAACATDSIVDYGINGGVTDDWDPNSLFDRHLFALGEVFLADSTGEMGIDESLFTDALDRAARADVPVTVHAEDASLFDETVRDRNDPDAWSAYRRAEAEIAAIERCCTLARERDGQVHIAHTSTPEGIDTAAGAGLTCEVTPHHMFLSRADLDDLGTHGRMNPPLRSESRREAVFDRVAEGPVDMVATDHAPHTRSEKDATIWDAPSGVPGVETALPLLLAAVSRGRLDLERVRDLTARNPATIFDIPEKGTVSEGTLADLVLVDLSETETIRATSLHTNCEWTPFAGHEAIFPEWTMCRGRMAYRRDPERFLEERGRNVRL